MEQQDQVQGVTESSKDSGEFARETTELTINDVSAPYEFIDGIYYCKDLDGGFISLDTLRRAWALKVKEEKVKHLRAVAVGQGSASKHSASVKEKARKDFVKWQQTQVD